MKKIGVLSGGGDSPAINAAIRAVVRKSLALGYEVWGIKDGWRGLLEGNLEKLTLDSVSGIIFQGGTILGTSRTNPFKREDGPQKIEENVKRFQLDAIIAMGGDDTLGVAHKLNKMGIPAVGVPQTIDNDLCGTDYAIGFDSALSMVTDAIDKLHTTACSHHRVMVVEIMGRDAGWLALLAGLAGGADVILIPEVKFNYDDICRRIEERRQRGKQFSIIAVAEGAAPEEIGAQVTQKASVDAFGHVRLGGISSVIAEEIEKRTGYETRATILGHLQRGGTPTAYDRIMATRLGVKAVDLVHNGQFDRMACVKGNQIDSVPLEEAVAKVKPVDMELFETAKLFY